MTEWNYSEIPRMTISQLREKGLQLAAEGQTVGANTMVREIRRRVDRVISDTGMSTPALARADKQANEIVAAIRRNENS